MLHLKKSHHFLQYFLAVRDTVLKVRLFVRMVEKVEIRFTTKTLEKVLSQRVQTYLPNALSLGFVVVAAADVYRGSVGGGT